MSEGQSPFIQSFALFEKYSILPVAPYRKYPARFNGKEWFPLKEWDVYSKRHATLEELNEWATWPQCGIGVCTGKLSNIIGIDFDNNFDGIHEKIKSFLPPTPVKKMGRGETWFYAYNGEESRSFKKNGKSIIEILSDGRQTVLPPSYHPDNFQYKWLEKETLLSVDSLPKLNPDDIERISSLFLNPEKNIPLPFPKQHPVARDLTRAYDALFRIPPDCDYDTWLKCGMALRNEFGSDGFQMWDTWSQKGKKYNAKEMKGKLDSFKKNGVGIGTLYYFAKQYGDENVKKVIEMPDKNPILLEDHENIGETFSNEIKERKIIVDPMIAIGELSNLTAYTKIGKTFMSLQLALSIVGKIPFLGFPIGNIGEDIRVLYIGKELSIGALKIRIHEQAKALGIKREDLYRLEVWTDKNLFFNDTENPPPQLKIYLSQFRPHVVFLDPFSMYLGLGIDENDRSHMQAIMNLLKKVAFDYNTAFFFMHHIGKQAKINNVSGSVGQRGSSAIAATSDNNFTLTAKEEKTGDIIYNLEFEMRNEENPKKMTLLKKGTLFVRHSDHMFDLCHSNQVTSDDIVNLLMLHGREILNSELKRLIMKEFQVGYGSAINYIQKALRSGKICKSAIISNQTYRLFLPKTNNI